MIIAALLVLVTSLSTIDATEEILGRLRGHATRVVDGRLHIDSIAGEGRPLVGCVERRGRELWLRTEDSPSQTRVLRLEGRLAVPRIAGPGYLVWVLGETTSAASLRIRRIGILLPAHRSPCADASPRRAGDDGAHYGAE